MSRYIQLDKTKIMVLIGLILIIGFALSIQWNEIDGDSYPKPCGVGQYVKGINTDGNFNCIDANSTSTIGNIDGGTPESIYTIDQNIDGGSP